MNDQYYDFAFEKHVQESESQMSQEEKINNLAIGMVNARMNFDYDEFEKCYRKLERIVLDMDEEKSETIREQF